ANRRRLPRSAFSFGASPSANPVSDRREDASRLDPFRTAIAYAQSLNHRRHVSLLCLCLAASLAISWSGAVPGSRSVTPASAAPSAPRHFFGFTPDFGTVSDNTLSANYKRLRRAGARWVRFGVYWWYIER